MAEALRAFGGDPDAIASAARAPGDLLGYCEVHIEQGPVLERRGAPVGVVTTITGQTHAEVGFLGEAGHAGHRADERPPRRAGRRGGVDARRRGARPRPPGHGGHRRAGSRVEPGARNVIPGAARMTLDVRHTSNAVRREAIADLRAEAQRIAAAREVELDWDARGETAARADWTRTWPTGSPTRCEATGHAARAAAQRRRPRRRGDGGADRVAMLFVRCEGGISHNPAEAVAEADVAVALDVLERFVGELA